MDPIPLVDLLMVVGGIIGVGSMYLFVATAIDYRHRDNGLAYILFVLGVGIWNGMFATQFLVTDPVVEQFFLSLSIVGALLAGLGWFLFAATASSTPDLPARRPIFGAAAVLVGVSIAIAMTTPVHGFSLQVDTAGHGPIGTVDYGVGYWLHTALIAGLFLAGAVIFASAWHGTQAGRYLRWYASLGVLTALLAVGSGGFAPPGVSVAPLIATSLTTVGWLQAKRWSGFREIRSFLRPAR